MSDEDLFRQCLQVMEGTSTPLLKPLVVELVKVRLGRNWWLNQNKPTFPIENKGLKE